MAKHEIYVLGNTSYRPVGTSMSTTYDIINGVLTVYWKERKIFTTPVTNGDAFTVHCNGGEPDVFPLTLPRDTHHRILWLLGFRNKSKRYTDKNKFCSDLEDRRTELRKYNIERYKFDEKCYNTGAIPYMPQQNAHILRMTNYKGEGIGFIGDEKFVRVDINTDYGIGKYYTEMVLLDSNTSKEDICRVIHENFKPYAWSGYEHFALREFDKLGFVIKNGVFSVK